MNSFFIPLYVYEKGADHIVLLAADRRVGGAALGEVRKVSAVGGMAAGDLYAGESGAAGGRRFAGSGGAGRGGGAQEADRRAV